MKRLSVLFVAILIGALFISTSVSALILNGDFESGTFGSWTKTSFRNNGFSQPPGSAMTDLSAIVGGPAVSPLSMADPRTNNVLQYPAYGRYSARVNSELSYTGGGYQRNANRITQQLSAYIDPADNLSHVKFAYAAVMVNPTSNPHTDEEKPYFRVRVTNVTNGNDVIYDFASYVNEPGKNWQNGASFGSGEFWKYLNWQVIDLTSSPTHPVNSGDTIRVEVTAAGCSLGGHPGYVYIDEITDNEIAGPTIKATGPATVATGGQITYNYNYRNGSASTIDTAVSVTQPTGVTFTSVSDTANCTLSSGTVTCNFNGMLPVTNGDFSITGNVTASNGTQLAHGNYSISSSGFPTAGGQTVLTQVVSRGTSTSVNSSADPSFYGQNVTFTANVSPASGSGTPSGTVQFSVNGTNLGSPVTLVGGSAQISTSSLAVGNHPVTATYSGDLAFDPSSASLAGGQDVGPAPTSTSVTSSTPSSAFGQPVTFTANVSPTTGVGVPSGTVQFAVNGTNLGVPVPLVGGVAQIHTSTLAVGNSPVTATYSGETSYLPSNGSLAGGQVVSQATTSTSVTTSDPSTTYGESVTFTATIVTVTPGAGTPTGTVTFFDGSGPIAGCQNLAVNASGQAACSISNLSAGAKTITASYSGSSNFSGGGSTVGQTIIKADLTVTASSHTVTYGDPSPSVTPGFTGFVLGEGPGAIAETPMCSSVYTAGSSVAISPYPTSCSGGSSANYNFVFTGGNISVNKAPLSVTASSHTVTFGDAVPAVVPGYNGFVLSQGPSVLITAPTCSTAYTVGATVAGSPYATSCGGGVSDNYAISYTNGSVSMSKAPLLITASSHALTYGDPVPTVTATYAGFLLGQGPNALSASPTCSTNYTQGTGAGTSGLSATCNGAASANYDISYESGAVTVGKAQLTVTASDHTVSFGSNPPAVTASYSGFLLSQGPNSLVQPALCTTTYRLGDNVSGAPYSTYCSGAVSPNYDFNYINGSLNMTRAIVTITASSHSLTYGDTPPSVTASFAGFLFVHGPEQLTTQPVCTTSYSPGAAANTAGLTTSCSGAAAANYDFTYISGSVSVGKAQLNVVAPSSSITYGDPVPALSPSYTGFVLGQTASNLTAQPVCSTTYSPASTVGGYPTSCSGGSSANYNFAYINGNITVGKKELTITADDKTRVYGSPNPVLTSTITGFAAGQTLSTSGVTGAPSLSTTAMQNSTVAGGPYPISAGLGTLQSANYSFRFVNGMLNIERALLTISAVNATRMFGMPNPSLIFQHSGFVNGENALTSGLTGVPNLVTTATLASPVGEYPITASQGTLSAANYHFAFNGAMLTVTKAPTETLITNMSELSANNSSVGQPYNVRWSTTTIAAVTGTPTGTVTVSDDTGATCSAPVSVGVCTLTSTLPGYRSVSAAYSGDGNFHPSASGSSFHPTVVLIAGNIKRQVPFGPLESLSGVTVTISGSVTGQTVSDSAGNYSFASMVNAGDYTVRPSGLGYSYSPVDRSYTQVTANVLDADFIASGSPVVIPSPTPSGSPSPTPVSTPTPGVTPTPAVSPTPSATPTPGVTPTPDPTPTPGDQVGGEGDVVDSMGIPMGGDGVHTDDLLTVRGFALGNTEPDMGTGQFQRGDTAPRDPQANTFGDGGIDASDVTVVRLYSLGMLPNTTAAGPILPEVAPTPIAEPGNQRVIRAVSVGTRPGEMVTVQFEIVSQGNESSASFTVNFDRSVLSNPVVSVGNGVSEGTNLGTNVNHLADGKIGILVDSVVNYSPGTRQILRIRFNVSPTAQTGLYPVTFEDGPTIRSVSSNGGILLPTTYETGYVQIGSTSSGVSIVGRVTTPTGQGIRNALVTITDQNGAIKTASTGSFGIYRFENVESGRNYVVSVASKRYRFSARPINLVDSVTDLDFVAQE